MKHYILKFPYRVGEIEIHVWTPLEESAMLQELIGLKLPKELDGVVGPSGPRMLQWDEEPLPAWVDQHAEWYLVAEIPKLVEMTLPRGGRP